jgi:hypothetical protein
MTETAKSRLSSNLKISLISLVGLCIISICCIALLFVPKKEIQSTPTPTIFAPGTAIIQTSNAAIMQTQLASSPTLNITSTFLPTLTQAVTLAVIDTLQPPATVLIPFPTKPPTATFVFLFPTSTKRPSGGGGSGICSCSGDTLNCPDFSSHSSAQACFDYCVQQGAGDIHKLDRDNDGLACEG